MGRPERVLLAENPNEASWDRRKEVQKVMGVQQQMVMNECNACCGDQTNTPGEAAGRTFRHLTLGLLYLRATPIEQLACDNFLLHQ